MRVAVLRVDLFGTLLSCEPSGYRLDQAHPTKSSDELGLRCGQMLASAFGLGAFAAITGDLLLGET